MASNLLFDRYIEFSIVSPLGGQGFRWRDHKIEVSMSKDLNQEEINTGKCVITNVGRNVVSDLASSVDPRLYLYTIRAGYGDQKDNLPIVSQGRVSETRWAHEGGDSRIEFTLTEDSKYLDNSYSLINQKRFSQGTSVLDMIQKVFPSPILQTPDQKKYSIPTVKYKGNIDQTMKDLSNTKFETNWELSTNVKDDVYNILDSAGYKGYIDNNNFIIHKDIEKDTTPDEIREIADAVVTMNFSTGMLSANIENVYDYQFQTVEAWVNLRSLYIDSVKVGNVVEIDEPKYPHLHGQYLIYTTDHSLENKGSGNFIVQSRCINLNFVNKVIGKSQAEIFKTTRLRDLERLGLLKKIGGQSN